MTLSSNFNQFAGKLLVSKIPLTGTLNDLFHRSVIFVLESGETGVAGLDLGHADSHAKNVYHGGPVGHLALLHRSNTPGLNGGKLVENAPYATFVSTFSHPDIPESYKDADTIEDVKSVVGITSWDAEQLQEEVAAGFWHVMDADEALLFDTPSEQLFDTCVKRAGIVLAPGMRPN